ncbi:MAG: response regulator transcription factor [Chloroflexaceae bacterium]|jgi:DNA-binding NarL/FixJ family response regulator|nr:response regulator transcription factor [Chloroflexaceae bacterium]
MNAIRVLIVDDHAIVRQGLRTIMQVLPGLAYAGEAANGHEALAQARTLRPDLVLMDLVMPELDGVAAIAAIKAEQPDLPIIALTTFAEHEHVLGAVQAGANGYLLKDIDMHELARAIQHVYRGQPYLHPEATRLLLQATANPEPQGERLTGREQEVLTHVASGLTNRQIAEALHISEKTVSVHISNLLGKLGLTSRTQAALYATRMGLVPPGELG